MLPGTWCDTAELELLHQRVQQNKKSIWTPIKALIIFTSVGFSSTQKCSTSGDESVHHHMALFFPFLEICISLCSMKNIITSVCCTICAQECTECINSLAKHSARAETAQHTVYCKNFLSLWVEAADEVLRKCLAKFNLGITFNLSVWEPDPSANNWRWKISRHTVCCLR